MLGGSDFYLFPREGGGPVATSLAAKDCSLLVSVLHLDPGLRRGGGDLL